MTTTTRDCMVVYNDKIIEDFLEMFEFADDLTTSCPTPSSCSVKEKKSSLQKENDTRQAQSKTLLACDPNHETPRIKKNGILNQPVRRRLFSSQGEADENCGENWPTVDRTSKAEKKKRVRRVKAKDNATDAEGPQKRKTRKRKVESASRKSDRGSKTSPPIKTKELPENQKLPQSIEKVVPISTNRKIAQLVVWTKNCAKLEDKKGDQPSVKPPREIEQLQEPPKAVATTTTGPVKDFNPEGDLFYVHYPVRPAYEVSKNKVKAPKRQRISSPPPIPSYNQKRRRSSDKSIISEDQAQADQETSGGLDKTYPFLCLDNQRQMTKCGEDFRVEKLFQSESDIPVDQAIETQAIFELSLSDPQSGATVFTTSSVKNLPGEGGPEGEQVPEPDPFPEKVVELEATKIPEVREEGRRCGETCSEEDQSSFLKETTVEGAIEHSDFPPFTLPDQFTVVTSDVPNEFDLLIQNVVHEELVDGNGDDVELENFAKKMKLNNGSNCSSKISSQEGMVMDEAGKPRCTYTELIEKALTETGGLTVSEIYTWISERYPFYKPDDDRWKNSVRHNLSINPYFKKGEKARSGAGHLWTISEESKGLRPSMVSWDEVSLDNDRRKCPYDPSEFTMPMESETDRAVANILGRYVSECRANQEASKGEKRENKLRTGGNEEQQSQTAAVRDEGNLAATKNLPTTQIVNTDNADQELGNQPQVQQPDYNPPGAMRDEVPGEATQFNINELNSGQFTVDLSGITIPEGGSINFEDLVNNGRLIYIQTDLEANKENESTQAIILNENLIPELAGLANSTTSAPPNNDERYQSFYSDSLGLDLGFGKGDSISNVSFPQDDILAAACAQLISDDSQTQEHQDLTTLDQVIPMSSYGVPTSTNDSGNNGSGMSESLPTLEAAALYESRELGISYTYQAETNGHDLLN